MLAGDVTNSVPLHSKLSAAAVEHNMISFAGLLKEKFFFNLSFEKGSENASGASILIKDSGLYRS